MLLTQPRTAQGVKAKETTLAILSAAEALFLAKNYADVTMEQIAERSGLTKGALYHHFSSKEELYLRMMHAALDRMRALFSAALASPGGCRRRLGRLTQTFLELPPDQIGLMRLVRRDVNIFAASARGKLVRSYQEALPAVVEAAIRDGMRDGELIKADARLLAWNFVAMVEVTLGRYADSVLKNSRAKLDYVLELFFLGAATPRPAGRRTIS